MRTISTKQGLALLTAASLGSLLPADSDACGVPEPTVFRLTSTWARAEGELPARESRTRTFAITGGEVTGTPSWKQLAPGTYDYSSIAPAPRLEHAIEMTLIGPSGTRVISAQDQVFIRNTFTGAAPSTAVELSVGHREFSFALAGRFANAKWIGLDSRARTDADLAFVKAQHTQPLDAQFVSVDRLPGTELETVSVLTTDKTVTLVRDGHGLRTSFDGYPVGAFSLYGMSYVIATSSDRKTVWAEPIY